MRETTPERIRMMRTTLNIIYLKEIEKDITPARVMSLIFNSPLLKYGYIEKHLNQ